MTRVDFVVHLELTLALTVVGMFQGHMFLICAVIKYKHIIGFFAGDAYFCHFLLLIFSSSAIRIWIYGFDVLVVFFL